MAEVGSLSVIVFVIVIVIVPKEEGNLLYCSLSSFARVLKIADTH